MSTHALHPELGRLLATCTGSGVVVICYPAAPPPPPPPGVKEKEAIPHPHHFYAGVARPPQVSFLGALLLALGGDLHDGRRRYDEILVSSSASDENGLDLPDGERLPEPFAMSGATQSWWFRRRPEEAPDAAETNAADDDPYSAPSISATVKSTSARSLSPESRVATHFQVNEPDGRDFYLRHQQVWSNLQTLERNAHSTLYLVNLALFDYPAPGAEKPEHMHLTNAAQEHMRSIQTWIDSDRPANCRLDVVFYTRNRGRGAGFVGGGLPRRLEQDREQRPGIWPVTRYGGENAAVIPYPWGPRPWGDQFHRGEAFKPVDGTPGRDKSERAAYQSRTLRESLRGSRGEGKNPRIKLFNQPPTVPPRTRRPKGIDRRFWAEIDIPAIRAYCQRNIFQWERVAALVGDGGIPGHAGTKPGIFKTLENMQTRARRSLAQNPEDEDGSFTTETKDWQAQTTLVLWGHGGMGKTYLAEVLSEALFGRPAMQVPCAQIQGVHGARAYVYGSPTGYIGSDRINEFGQRIIESDGFQVVCIDEIEKIAGESGDFSAAVEPFFQLVYGRYYQPTNPQILDNERLYVWNTIFILTANLEKYPPEGMRNANVASAVRRRVSAFEYAKPSDQDFIAFIPWFLRRSVEDGLGRLAQCHCDPLPKPARAWLRANPPNEPDLGSLSAGLTQVASDVLARIQSRHPHDPPLFLDITPDVQAVLEGRA